LGHTLTISSLDRRHFFRMPPIFHNVEHLPGLECAASLHACQGSFDRPGARPSSRQVSVRQIGGRSVYMYLFCSYHLSYPWAQFPQALFGSPGDLEEHFPSNAHLEAQLETAISGPSGPPCPLSRTEFIHEPSLGGLHKTRKTRNMTTPKAPDTDSWKNDPTKVLSVRGAREHNLKGVDLDLPRDKDDRDDRPVRLGQVLARLRYDLCRRPAPLCGACQPMRVSFWK
jgi:hypothetical protein